MGEEREKELKQHKARIRALVAALRSGDYAQTVGVLHRPDLPSRVVGLGGHCCLGVACEVAIKGGAPVLQYVDETSAAKDPRSKFFSADNPDDSSFESMPFVVFSWFGFDSSNPVLRVPREVMEQALPEFANFWNPDREFRATTLNDDHHLTLPLIGDCFEYTFLREDWEQRHAQD